MIELDRVQSTLKSDLKQLGFRVRARNFNRSTGDGLTQVITLQGGRFDPPGTYTIPGLRENYYGKFTVEIGVHIPELDLWKGFDRQKQWFGTINCDVRARLGEVIGSDTDLWWDLPITDHALAELRARLLTDGIAFLERFGSREQVLDDLITHKDDWPFFGIPPRITCAVIFAKMGRFDEARDLFREHLRSEPHSAAQLDYLRSAVERLGLGTLQE